MSIDHTTINDLFLSIDEISKIFYDITPIPCNESINTPGHIDCTNDFQIAYNYQRAISNVK